uniref:FAD-binding domain-containing protein n=1 Tax=Fagus sylvatica TaxID=28930 RepID=A0A2N9HSY5_FAGSY
MVFYLVRGEKFISSPLRYRHPWELLWGNISKGNVCVTGDALHPMTPDIGQGGCAALEDGVILARCLTEALLKEQSGETKEKGDKEREEYKRVEMELKKYAKQGKQIHVKQTLEERIHALSRAMEDAGGSRTQREREKVGPAATTGGGADGYHVVVLVPATGGGRWQSKVCHGDSHSAIEVAKKDLE